VNLSELSSWYFPAGVAIGFVAAAPIGPVNILVIQRTLQRSVQSALVLGLGAAMGDALFAAFAAFGLATLTAELNASKDMMRIIGGVIMLGFASALWRTHPHLNEPGRKLPRAPHLAAAIFFMTITNPATILWFVATFQAIGFADIGWDSNRSAGHSALIVLGVLAGSILWWLCLSGFTARWRHRLTDRHLGLANHIAAAILLLSGTAAILAGILD
jgi:threonine/homoserine/homoserine lactone efflux protein